MLDKEDDEGSDVGGSEDIDGEKRNERESMSLNPKPPIEISKPNKCKEKIIVNDMVDLIISAATSKGIATSVAKNTEPLQNNSPSCTTTDLILPVLEIPTDETPKSRWNKLGAEIIYETPSQPQFDRGNILQTNDK